MRFLRSSVSSLGFGEQHSIGLSSTDGDIDIIEEEGRTHAEIPVTMHYHRSELMPGFDPATLEEFLGIDGNVIPRFVTQRGGDDLSCSFVSLIE